MNQTMFISLNNHADSDFVLSFKRSNVLNRRELELNSKKIITTRTDVIFDSSFNTMYNSIVLGSTGVYKYHISSEPRPLFLTNSVVYDAFDILMIQAYEYVLSESENSERNIFNYTNKRVFIVNNEFLCYKFFGKFLFRLSNSYDKYKIVVLSQNEFYALVKRINVNVLNYQLLEKLRQQIDFTVHETIENLISNEQQQQYS